MPMTSDKRGERWLIVSRYLGQGIFLSVLYETEYGTHSSWGEFDGPYVQNQVL